MIARSPMSPEPARLRLDEAAILGLLHGPAELLPVSSSGHITLIPWLAGSEYAGVEPELRKAFEVALHAGTAAALLIALREEVDDAARAFDARRAGLAYAFQLVEAIEHDGHDMPMDYVVTEEMTLTISRES